MTVTCVGTRSLRARGGVRFVPESAAGAGAGVAAADARDAGGRRGAVGVAGAVSGAGTKVAAMDLGSGVWAGGYGSVRAVHRVCGALATAVGAGRVRGKQFVELADFSRRLVERMAIDGDII